jgi:hypothetical protein
MTGIATVRAGLALMRISAGCAKRRGRIPAVVFEGVAIERIGLKRVVRVLSEFCRIDF